MTQPTSPSATVRFHRPLDAAVGGMIAGAAGTTERSPKSIGSLLAARPIAKLASWVQYSVVDFRILGPLEVWDPDRPLPLGGGKQRALLAILLLEANRVVSTERLIELLWGEEAP